MAALKGQPSAAALESSLFEQPLEQPSSAIFQGQLSSTASQEQPSSAISKAAIFSKSGHAQQSLWSS